MTLEQRFWAKVDRRDPDGCWEWAGAHAGGTGYAQIGGNRRTLLAHRVAYEFCIGPIPPGLQVDHLCCNRGCVNPKHLEPVTSGENTRRATRYVCRKGHALAGDNVVHRPNGQRYCQTCALIRGRERYARDRVRLGRGSRDTRPNGRLPLPAANPPVLADGAIRGPR